MDGKRLFRIAQRVAAEQVKRDLKWWQDCCHDPPPEEAPKYWRRDIPDAVYVAIQKEKRETTIKWVGPDIEEAANKFQKVALDLGLDIEDIQSKIPGGRLTVLNAEVWAHLANSDSWTIESMEEAEVRAAMRDEDLQPILDVISAGKTVSAPIVLWLGDGTPYLVTGNDKLMIARAMDTEAQVFFVDMASSSKQNEMVDMPVTGYLHRSGPAPAR